MIVCRLAVSIKLVNYQKSCIIRKETVKTENGTALEIRST